MTSTYIIRPHRRRLRKEQKTKYTDSDEIVKDVCRQLNELGYEVRHRNVLSWENTFYVNPRLSDEQIRTLESDFPVRIQSVEVLISSKASR
jgi:hypothetical protein